MAGTAKMTIAFDYVGYGWTETYFRPFATNPSDIGQVARNLIEGRMAISGPGVTAKYIRFSDAANPGVVAIYPFSFKAVPPGSDVGTVPNGTNGKTIAVFTADNFDADRPYSDISVRMYSADFTHYRIMYLGGVPRDLVQPGGSVANNNAWLGAFNSWLNLLTASGNTAQAWQFRVTGRNVPTRFPIQNINAINPAVITATGSNFQANDLVQIQGFRGIKGVRYKGIVVAPTANTFQLAGYTPSQSVQNGQKGNCFKPAVTYIPIASGTLLTETERKRGRPFRSPVGRRPNRVS